MRLRCVFVRNDQPSLHRHIQSASNTRVENFCTTQEHLCRCAYLFVVVDIAMAVPLPVASSFIYWFWKCEEYTDFPDRQTLSWHPSKRIRNELYRRRWTNRGNKKQQKQQIQELRDAHNLKTKYWSTFYRPKKPMVFSPCPFRMLCIFEGFKSFVFVQCK